MYCIETQVMPYHCKPDIISIYQSVLGMFLVISGKSLVYTNVSSVCMDTYKSHAVKRLD